MAKDKGLKISEYGVFRGEKRIAGRVEEEIYAALGLPWIPAELREDRGEIELALKADSPKLSDIKTSRATFMSIPTGAMARFLLKSLPSWLAA